MADLGMTNFIETRCFNVKKHYLEREEGEKNVVFERTFVTKSNAWVTVKNVLEKMSLTKCP